MKRLVQWCGVVALCASVACGAAEEPEVDAGEDSFAQCDETAAAAVRAYNDLDRSCAQDSDCEYRSIGGCGCPVPVAKSANDSTYRSAVSDARDACDEFYSAPGAQTCSNNVVCNFNPDGGSPVACVESVCVDSEL